MVADKNHDGPNFRNPGSIQHHRRVEVESVDDLEPPSSDENYSPDRVVPREMVMGMVADQNDIELEFYQPSQRQERPSFNHLELRRDESGQATGEIPGGAVNFMSSRHHGKESLYDTQDPLSPVKR